MTQLQYDQFNKVRGLLSMAQEHLLFCKYDNSTPLWFKLFVLYCDAFKIVHRDNINKK